MELGFGIHELLREGTIFLQQCSNFPKLFASEEEKPYRRDLTSDQRLKFARRF
jgi:hypothetical protein